MYNSIISIKLPIFIWKVYLRNHHPQPSTTIHNQPQPATTSRNHPQLSKTTHNYPQLSTTTHNHPQSSTTIHNHPKNHHNHPKKPPTTTHNHPQRPNSYPKKSKLVTSSYMVLISEVHSDVNTETDVGFDSDMKQWYIWMRACVTVCIYFIISTTFSLDWLFVFCQYSK